MRRALLLLLTTVGCTRTPVLDCYRDDECGDGVRCSVEGRCLTAGVGGEPGAGGQPGAGGEPGCVPPTVHAELVEDRLYRRREPVEITFRVEPAGDWQMSFAADPGGRLTGRADRVFYGTGGEEPDDLPWPWWTGPVQVTLTARSDDGCTGQTTVPVRVAGDVLVADLGRSHLMMVGSDGQVLGRFAQVTDRGLRAVTLLPLEQGGELLVSIRGRDGQPPLIRRLDRTGATVNDFETTNLAGEALWPTDRMPLQLAWDPINHLVVANEAPGGLLHRFTALGEYVDSLEVPDGPGSFNDRTYGFAVLGDGTLLAGRADGRNVYRLLDGAFEAFTQCPDGCTAMGDALDGGAVIGAGNENDVEWFHVDLLGRDRWQREDFLGFDPQSFHPFADGYLAVPNGGSRIVYLDAELNVAAAEDTPFRLQGNFDVLPQPEGLVWLNDE